MARWKPVARFPVDVLRLPDHLAGGLLLIHRPMGDFPLSRCNLTQGEMVAVGAGPSGL